MTRHLNLERKLEVGKFDIRDRKPATCVWGGVHPLDERDYNWYVIEDEIPISQSQISSVPFRLKHLANEALFFEN